MSTTAIVIITVIATVAAAWIAKIVYDARKGGDNSIPWDKIRPILTEVFTQVVQVEQADKLGYQALEDYAVNYVKGKIDASDFFTPDEKKMLSESFIRSIIGPKLKELYDQTTKG